LITNRINHCNIINHWFNHHRVLIAPESGEMRIRYITPKGVRILHYEYTRIEDEHDWRFEHSVRELH
jgi:hypothetical protein